jgi:hypothetical protein
LATAPCATVQILARGGGAALAVPGLVRVALLAVVLVACDADAPAAIGPVCEAITGMQPSEPNEQVDVLLVISDSRAMADVPFADGMRSLAGSLQSFDFGLPSLRVGVVGPSGVTTSGCALVDGDFLESIELPWFWCSNASCRDQNYNGDLADALTCMAAIPLTADEPAALLERALAVLEGDDFVRPGAILFVVLITAEDDASPRPLADYAERIHALHGEAGPIELVGTVSPRDLPRLDALRAAFPNRSNEARLDGPWGDAVGLARLGWGEPNRCVGQSLEDIDDAVGIQVDCVAVDFDGAILPRCAMVEPERPDPETLLPCYWIRPEGDAMCGLEAVVERLEAAPRRYARLHCSCTLAPDEPDVIAPP